MHTPPPSIERPTTGHAAPLLSDRSDRRVRRLNQAFARLGFLDIFGPDWVTIDSQTGKIIFGEVPDHQFQVLTMHLEDLLTESFPRASIPEGRSAPNAYATLPVATPFTPRSVVTGPHIGGRA